MATMDSPIVIIGGGLAGLAVALRLAPRAVTLVTAGRLGTEASTPLAQGGLAAALGREDSADLHAADTLAAAAGLADAEIVSAVTRAAPAVVDWLMAQGVVFDRQPDGELLLGREAAHSASRIVHADGDRTGAAIEVALVRRVRETPSVTVLEDTVCEALLTGTDGRVSGLRLRTGAGARTVAASAVVLATGGVGGLYGASTNPLGSVGTGLALAAGIGAVLRDVEFVQFHPTAIATGTAPLPLATEALRGAGATLVDEAGRDLMAGVPGGALAPRDVVAATLYGHIQAGRRAFLELPEDLRAALPTRFPGVAALCAKAGISLADGRIPVRPAAHYHMGGIRIDRRGRSSVDGLWACGEVASSGLHGANRLASNSLLEAVVTAFWVADDLAGADLPAATVAEATNRPEPYQHDEGVVRAKVRAVMDAHLGITRTGEGLRQALGQLLDLYGSTAGHPAVTAALLIAAAAYRRTESRGGHRRRDYPIAAPASQSQEITLDAALALARTLHNPAVAA